MSYGVATISQLVQPDDIVAARELLSDVVLTTPMHYSRVLSELVGGPVYLKCENLQRTGSFKARGAYLRIWRLSDAQRARGVIAASAGNHAQGVAFAAARLGARATVVMPERAPLPKVEATRSYGADVVLHGSTVEDALARAQELAAEHGSIFIHPFEHPDVLAGQGILHGAAVQHDGSPVRPGGLDLGQRSALRHDHGGPGAEPGGRERHALSMVARAGGDHPAGALRVGQPPDAQVRAAGLERPGALQVLALQVDRPAELLGERPRVQHRGVQDDIVENLARRGHVIGTRRGRRRHA